MFLIDDLIKGFTSGSIEGIAKAAVGVVREFHSSPEDLARVEAAANEFILKDKELAVRDRESARQMAVSADAKTPRNLTYIYTGAFFLTMGAVFVAGVMDVHLTAWAERTVDMFLGVLLGMVLSTKEFYLGASASDTLKQWLGPKHDE